MKNDKILRRELELLDQEVREAEFGQKEEEEEGAEGFIVLHGVRFYQLKYEDGTPVKDEEGWAVYM